MLKQYLQLKLSQKLSPQQIQLMKLIELPLQELEERLSREIEENPALESGKEKDEDDYFDILILIMMINQTMMMEISMLKII